MLHFRCSRCLQRWRLLPLITLIAAIMMLHIPLVLNHMYDKTEPTVSPLLSVVSVPNQSNATAATSKETVCTKLPSHCHLISPQERTRYLQHPFPPYLISFGGSGNTITRLVTEYLTSFYSGSIYDSDLLKKYHGFTGEKLCDPRVIMVKIHPEKMALIKGTVDYKGNMLLNGTSPCTGDERLRKIPKNPKYLRNAVEQYVHNKVAKAIYLVRDPWRATFSIFNLEEGIKYRKGHFVTSHVASVYAVDFDVDKFKKYFAKKIKLWLWVIRFIEIHSELCADSVGTANSENDCFVIVHYEKIISSDLEVRTEEMMKLIGFLMNSETFESRYQDYSDRIQCVLEMKYRNDARMGSFDRQFVEHPELKNTSAASPNGSFIQFEDALSSAGDLFVCQCWKKIKTEAIKHGYSIWNDTVC